MLRYIRGAKRVLLTSAYVSSAGLELLLPELEKLLKRGGGFSLYATFDGTTSTKPEAFKKLVGFVETYGDKVELLLYPSASSLFHPKAFLFETKNGWAGIIGSANLTNAALTGKNFEACIDCDSLPTKEVNELRSKLDKLRTNGQLHKVTADNLDEILRLFGIFEGAAPGTAKAKKASGAGKKTSTVKRAIDAAVPVELPPLLPLAFTPREFVERICGLGKGIGTRTDLTKLSVSLDLAPLHRAGLLDKEATKSLGLATERTRRGYSFSLIPDDVRSVVSKATRSTRRLISGRSMELGFARWIPLAFLPGLRAELAAKTDIQVASELLESHRGDLVKTLEKTRTDFRSEMGVVADSLVTRINKKSEWEVERLAPLGLTYQASTVQVRNKIVDLFVTKYQDRIRTEFVDSQLSRLTFEPMTFEFPLHQSMDDDDDYGHKYFLASLVWTCTDRLLQHGDGVSERGASELAKYLERRRIVYKGRDNASPADWDARAGSWLETNTSLEDAVASFRVLFGPEPFTWDTEDVPGFFIAPSGDNRIIQKLIEKISAIVDAGSALEIDELQEKLEYIEAGEAVAALWQRNLEEGYYDDNAVGHVEFYEEIEGLRVIGAIELS